MAAAYGIDVSWYQQQINWSLVRSSGKQFAIIRATLGYTYTDPFYDDNVVGARAAGVVPGAYHVYKPSQSIRLQADHFYSVVGKLQDGDVIPWIDAELTETMPEDERPNLYNIAQGLAELIVACEERFGKPIGLYTGAWWWNQMPSAERNNPRWQGIPTWFAAYTQQPGVHTLPYGFKTYNIHQYSSSGRVGGVNGNCDLNYAPDFESIRRRVAPPDDWKAKVEQRLASISTQIAEIRTIIKGA